MKRVSVEAFEDKARPEGGHAVILLRGLAATPPAPALRIKLVDASVADADLEHWPSGLLTPVGARVTAQGVELTLGPDVTQCPLLLPGTAVEIEVAALDSRGEFLWPDVTPLARPKRRGILGRAIAPLARVDGGRTEGTPPAVGPDVSALGVWTNLAAASSPPPPGEVVAAPMSAPVAPAGMRAEEPSNLAVVQASRPAEPSPAPEPIAQPGGRALASPAASTQAMRGPETATGRLSVGESPQTPPGPASDMPASSAADTAADATAYVTWYPHARGGMIGEAATTPAAPGESGPSKTDWLGRLTSLGDVARDWRFVAAVVLAVLAIEAGLAAMGNARSFMGPRREAVTADAGGAGDHQPPSGLLYESLHAAATSPRGVASQGISANRALENAAASLQAGGARDTDEGAFWLKRFLASAHGDERSLRALTQLGTTYAEPAQGQAQFSKARQIWELSGALGDPVALCFLGRLFEGGLGVAADRSQALRWFERAKVAGGCPQVDEAIARLK